MSSTTILHTPPAPSSKQGEFLSLRPSRTKPKCNDLHREQNISPIALVSKRRIQSPLGCSYHDSSQTSPSPLRQRVLFQDDSESSDSEDEDMSPSLRNGRTSFVSQRSSAFLNSWVIPSKAQLSHPIEDDEGLFLSNKAAMSPVLRPQHSSSGIPVRRGVQGAAFKSATISSRTPAPKQRSPFVTLRSVPARTKLPETPAVTEWHLRRQAESMTKLSLGDPDEFGQVKFKRTSTSLNSAAASSPTPSILNRGRKRSLAGNELPRSTGKLFECLVDTPTVPSFRLLEQGPSPSPQKLMSRTFLPSVQPSPFIPEKDSYLTVPKDVSKGNIRSPSVSPKSSSERLAKKYKPRDSGIAGLDNDGGVVNPSTVGTAPAGIPTRTMEGFITPIEPSPHSAWPTTSSADNIEQVDDFILKTLAAGATAPKKKTIPGTPVKRYAHMASRPWMSSSKVVIPSVTSLRGRGGVPRKSLPLMFPNLSQVKNSPGGQEDSPTDRTFNPKFYGELGQGLPGSLAGRAKGAKAKLHALIRRSSSGAFSTSSSEDSLLGTPTKCMIPDAFHSPSAKPDDSRLHPQPSLSSRHIPNEYECPGKFEQDFLVVDDLGSGEFGSAIKVRYKHGDGAEVFAIKRSKRLEGIKHRRRLREEVDVLQHLKRSSGPQSHPNVLSYVDSWEQDNVLYIQTELCELGNYATFLAEYGARFEALDEARVWKICAELSNGLKFIHEAGVIHLDLKPANIFITGQGRFRIGDFGMASLWPRKTTDAGFEREGDREYMALEVLHGNYGPAADVFSLGMIILETATNIVVPDMGDDWHRLRQDDFSAIDFVVGPAPRGPQLVELITGMMRSDPSLRLNIGQVHGDPIISRARETMKQRLTQAIATSTSVFAASPLSGEPPSYLSSILQTHDVNSSH